MFLKLFGVQDPLKNLIRVVDIFLRKIHLSITFQGFNHSLPEIYSEPANLRWRTSWGLKSFNYQTLFQTTLNHWFSPSFKEVDKTCITLTTSMSCNRAADIYIWISWVKTKSIKSFSLSPPKSGFSGLQLQTRFWSSHSRLSENSESKVWEGAPGWFSQ